MTPDQLKASILQYAMEGKLVSQDPDDEPASELLKKIQQEKMKLVKEKKIKKTKPLPAISEDEIPFEIPDSWEWVRLEEIAYTIGNKTNQIKEKEVLPKGKFRVVSQSKEKIIGYYDDESKLLRVDGDCIVFGDHTALVKYIDFDFIIGADGTKVFKCFKRTDTKFIFYVLEFALQSIEKISGYSRHYKYLKNKCLPLPPLAEQKRIVDKLDRIMPLIDEYAKSYTHLAEIDSSFNDRMKKSILQYAMEGKLVPQDPSDQPASELLAEIQQEKTQLVKEKKIKKTKPLPEISEDEILYEIPESWVWARLSDVTNYIQRGKSPKYSNDSDLYVLSQKCIQWSGISLEKARSVSSEFWDKLEDYRFVQSGDLLWNSTGLGTVGRINIVDQEVAGYPVDSHVTIVRSSSLIDSRYLLRYLMSPVIQFNLSDYLTGSTKQKELGKESIEKILVPIPPLAEQKRIADKIDQIFDILS
ncbi:restriction endonuclease subunit S [Lactobacillus delbrueckii subsp. lactis]|jgi:type I restriction enzyme, S subunit|uniref:restriction endonuclease subunit S n=1 Tax=Lactobacillus delbrueckii TaxID=1584 RepID=UPI0001EC2F54|nr:restriction endonuclease subunit S [Lactobacillus delbrueckii]ADQ60429.1 Type I site-specific deoxyribonuclease chain S [Lactobacillus delbrueckii subsp. bulgaricus ND02]MBO3081905.1 restriction endonuclease subunit S [Lactobacillus delbrueckii subsp. bulgaricus]MCD5438312.1 restriction endonuclease subunit S [Lactobacillus delbrueckii subsp. lactis]MCD5468889.1 restriction endonuclease subunit S [Lactobacillus delbrueckii subsp. lactis]MCZ0795990.1 restriction endonuclease subunit S [Lacto